MTDRQVKTKAEGQPEQHKGEEYGERQPDVPVRSRIRERGRRQGGSRGVEGAPPRACRRHLRRGRPHQKRRRQSKDSRQDRETDPARWLGWFGCRCSDRRDLSSVYPGQRAGGCRGWRPHRPPPGRDVQLGPQGDRGDARRERGGIDSGWGGDDRAWSRRGDQTRQEGDEEGGQGRREGNGEGYRQGVIPKKLKTER